MEKKKEGIPLLDFLPARRFQSLPADATRTEDWTDRRPITHSIPRTTLAHATQGVAHLFLFSSLSLSLCPLVHALCFFSHSISAVDDHEWSRPHRRGSSSRDLVILLGSWDFAELDFGDRSARRGERWSAEDPSIAEDLCRWIIDIGNDTIQLFRRRARNYIPRAHQECLGEVQCVKTNQTHSAHRRQSDAKLSCIGLLMIISKELMTSTWGSIVGFNKVRRLFLEISTMKKDFSQAWRMAVNLSHIINKQLMTIISLQYVKFYEAKFLK